LSENHSLSIDSIVSAVGGQLTADLEGEIVILHLESGTYYGLSQVGAQIWNLVQKPTSVGDVRDALLKEYDVAQDQCERDLLALLSGLKAQKLIEIHEQ
jgi:hypothetical protein